jgi:hypothetical protein
MLGMALTLITARRTESKRIIVPLLWPHGRGGSSYAGTGEQYDSV